MMNQQRSAIRSNSPAARDPETAFGTGEPPRFTPSATMPDDDPPGANELGLSDAEVAQFRELGYVVKRGLIPAEGFEPILDLWWQQRPVRAAGMSRDDPATWIAPGKYWPEENRWDLPHDWMGDGEWPGPEDERAGADVGERVGRLPHKLTRDMSNDVWRWHGIGHDKAFVAVTSAHPDVLHMAEALLGGPVKRPHRNRGVYSVFPRDPKGPESKLGPHMDQSFTEMMVVTYLQDVGPGEGGFTIFPGSAQRLYPTSAQALNWVSTDASEAAMNDILGNVRPLEFVGKAGDVIFCHGWTVHSAGIHEGRGIRMAVIQDFNKVRTRGHMRWTAAGKHGGGRVNCDMDGAFVFDAANSQDDPADGCREVTNQWIMDSNEYVLDTRPPFDDMFEEWNLGRDPVVGNVVDEPPWWEKYDLPLLPTGDVPRGGGGMPAVPLSSIARYEGGGVWRVESQANAWMNK
jgi:hypothetical protein